MTEFSLPFPIPINEYILDSAKWKRNVYKTYDDMCKLQSSYDYDYVNFEWKYYQFYNGNRDLTIEKSPENSSSLTFLDLPTSSLEKIVGNLNVIDRLILRKVSHDLRNLVDDSEVCCDHFYFSFSENSCRFGNYHREIVYERNGEIAECTLFGFNNLFPKKKRLDSNDIYKVMVADMATILKNPKLKIASIHPSIFHGFNTEEFTDALASLNFKFPVKHFWVTSYEDRIIIEFLQHMDPNILNAARFTFFTSKLFEELKKLDQWKNLSAAKLLFFDDEIPIEELFHLKKIEISTGKITEERLVKIRDVLLKTSHFQRIYIEMNISNERYHGGYLIPYNGINIDLVNGIMSQDPAYDSETHRFLIPNSQEYFQLKFEEPDFERVLIIERIG